MPKTKSSTEKQTKAQTVERLEKAYKATNLVNSVESLDLLIKRVKKAQEKYATYTQEQVDCIFKAAATAANKVRIQLAKMAVADTKMGVVEDKIVKNHFAAEYIFNKHKTSSHFFLLHLPHPIHIFVSKLYILFLNYLSVAFILLPFPSSKSKSIFYLFYYYSLLTFAPPKPFTTMKLA